VEILQITPEQAQAFLESEVAAREIDPSFLQTPAWAQVKAGWQSRVIGFFEAKELVGTALVLARKMPKLNRDFLYIPEGPALPVKYLAAAVPLLRKYAISQNGFALRVGPMVVKNRWNSETIKEALDDELTNVAFLRAKIDFIETYFEAGEVDEIWLTFSDPQPAKPRKRLTSEQFINRYKTILKKDGLVHLKTDSDVLFESTEAEIKEHGYKVVELTWDLYKSLPEDLDPTIRDILHIKTHYEQLFTAKGSVIKYCSFRIH
jgi:hypothetical protein